jgi:hypothetical protein
VQLPAKASGMPEADMALPRAGNALPDQNPNKHICNWSLLKIFPLK